MPGFASCLITAIAVFSTAAQASIAKYCPKDQICFSVGVPSVSANADKGNVYFQIRAPTSYQYVALGTGTQMAGSNIFLLYTDGKGNVTLSNRAGTKYTQPTVKTGSDASQLTLLEGSGTKDGFMTANVRCSNCESWSSGTLSLKSTQAGWVAAWKSGPSLDSTSISQTISVHDDAKVFTFDMTKAIVESDSNPFVTRDGQPSNPTGSNSGSGGSSSNGVSVAQRPNINILIAHGVIMALVMVVLYPVGSSLIPLVGKWLAHGALQMVAFLLMWVGFGTGIKAAQDYHTVPW